MAYIGPEPNPGQNREVDDISSGFNGSEVNFTLQVSSQNVSPGSSNAIIVSLGGVVQNPGTDYTIAASTLTFTTAPASGLSFFGLVLGQSIDTEGTSDGSIVNASVSGSAAIARTKLANVDLVDDTSPQLGGDLDINGNNIVFGDSTGSGAERLKFGAGDDLHIYSNGTHNYIQSSSSAQVNILHGSENSIKSFPNGAVELYHNNVKKFETSANGIKVSDNGSNVLELNTNRFIINRDEGFFFDTTNTGNAIIFRVSDSSSLDTNALAINGNGTLYNISRSSSTTSLTLRKGTNASDSIDYLQCRSNSNALRLHIEGDGDVANNNNSYTGTSDVKLKENIVDASSQWDDIKGIKVRNFNFKESTGFGTDKHIGVVAQEIETVSAGLVKEIIDRDPDTGTDLGTTTKTVKYSILYMKAVKCLQEAMIRIETLETKVAALEAA